jgi:uncharacterized OB-fold protein
MSEKKPGVVGLSCKKCGNTWSYSVYRTTVCPRCHYLPDLGADE